jgi:hypothetical protein
MAKVVEKGIFGWVYLNTASSFVLKVINTAYKLYKKIIFSYKIFYIILL